MVLGTVIEIDALKNVLFNKDGEQRMLKISLILRVEKLERFYIIFSTVELLNNIKVSRIYRVIYLIEARFSEDRTVSGNFITES